MDVFCVARSSQHKIQLRIWRQGYAKSRDFILLRPEESLVDDAIGVTDTEMEHNPSIPINNLSITISATLIARVPLP